MVYIPREFKEGNRNERYDYAFVKLSEHVKLFSFSMLGINFKDSKATVGIYGYPHSHFKLNHNKALNEYGNDFTAEQCGRKGRQRILQDSDGVKKRRLRYQITT